MPKQKQTVESNLWRELLYERGQGDAAIDYFGVEPAKVEYVTADIGGKEITTFELDRYEGEGESWGWRYPIAYPSDPDKWAFRWKVRPDAPEKASGSNGAKNMSPNAELLPIKGKHPEFYIAGRNHYNALVQAIDDDNGVLYSVEGEDDARLLWQYKKNVIGFFGVNSLPNNLEDILLDMGVRELHHICDMDNQGITFGNLLHDKLFLSTIRVYAHLLPNDDIDHPRVKDTTDLWKDSTNDEDFLAALDSSLSVHFEYPTPSRTAQEAITVEAFPELGGLVIKALGDRPGTRNIRFKSNDWSNAIPCPCKEHEGDDKRPSAGFNRKTGQVRCFKCMFTYTLVQVAESLNIDTTPYLKPKKKEYAKESIGHGGTLVTLGPESKLYDPSKNQGQGNLVKSITGEADPWMIGRSVQSIAEDFQPESIEDFIATSQQMVHLYPKRLKGERLEEISPYLPFPIASKQFHDLDGYARINKAGKMIEVIAASGTGKTTFMEFIRGMYNNVYGIHTMDWSPEFDEDEHMDRLIQAQGGPKMTEIMAHEQAMFELKNDIGKARKFGKPLSEKEIAKALEILERIAQAPGVRYNIKRYVNNVNDLLLLFELAYDYALNVEGNRTQVAIVDYIQLLEAPPGAQYRNWTLNNSIGLMKKWANTEGERISKFTGEVYKRGKVLMWHTSQATKASSKSANGGDSELLTEEDSQFARPDAYNLIMSLKFGKSVSQDGFHQSYVCNVVKNSTGGKRPGRGKVEEGTPGCVQLWFSKKHATLSYLDGVDLVSTHDRVLFKKTIDKVTAAEAERERKEEEKSKNFRKAVKDANRKPTPEQREEMRRGQRMVDPETGEITYPKGTEDSEWFDPYNALEEETVLETSGQQAFYDTGIADEYAEDSDD